MQCVVIFLDIFAKAEDQRSFSSESRWHIIKSSSWRGNLIITFYKGSHMQSLDFIFKSVPIMENVLLNFMKEESNLWNVMRQLKI